MHGASLDLGRESVEIGNVVGGRLSAKMVGRYRITRRAGRCEGYLYVAVGGQDEGKEGRETKTGVLVVFILPD